MIAKKYITTITAVLVCICLLACGFIVYAANAFDTTKITEYQKRMFGDEIIQLDIQVNQEDWQSLLSNAQAKEWIPGDLIINGERFNSVGIRTKGNSSLSQGMRSNEGNFSLQFKFNYYVKGQTYYGLDAFCVNNMMGDATYMKDYISYEIMNYIGVDTPLTNYASVTVNGEDYGFGLALERYDKAFLDRVYNTSAGQLYSVKIGMGMRGNFEDAWQDIQNALPGRQQPGANTDGQQPGGGERPDITQGGGFPNFQQGGGFGGGMGGFGGGMGGFGGGRGGGSLVYTSDDPADYTAIFDNAVIGTASDKEKQRVITAIKNLNAGTDLEKYFDVDEILRYLAAHTVVVNLDSYSSNMAQNYYIYERDGKITILPWDYGLSFGGFQSGSASSVVNFPIDTPVSGVSMEDRPLINKLLEVDEYRERYHEYLRQIVEGYFESGLYESTIRNLDTKINTYVKNDVSAYYTYDQYEASLPQLIELGRLRAESIKGQLDGTIPSTSAGQNADSSALVDASSVNLFALGSMMGGGGMGQGGFPGGQGGWPDMQGGQGGFPGGFPGGQEGWPGGGLFDIDINVMQQAMQILQDAGGVLTDDVKTALLELGLTEEQIDMLVNMQNRMPGGNRGQGGFPDRGGQNVFPGGNNAGGGQGNPPQANPPQANGGQGNPPQGNGGQGNPPQGNMPGGNGMSTPAGTTTQSGINTGYAIIISVSLVLLIGATVFVAKPKKNAV